MQVDVDLFHITFEDDYQSINSREDYDKHTYNFMAAGIEVVEYKEAMGYCRILKNTSMVRISDKSGIVDLMMYGLKVKIESKVTTSVDISKQLSEMAGKTIQLTTDGGSEYNNHCDVHMPGQALASYNDILLLEDSCSDVLQDSIQKGWRIIAACPQANQRRPDYILGRFNPNDDTSYKDAKRNANS